MVWRVKYDGTCSRCGTPLLRGMPAVSERAAGTIRCVECPTPPAPAAPSSDDTASAHASPEPLTVDPGVAGASARREAERRAAKHDAAITERWGTGFVAKVARAVSVEPQSTRAWRIGASGEEQVAEALAKVPGIRILNDRRVAGTRRNIDHIVIGPAGVFVVDAKRLTGRIEIQNRGWFFRPDYRLTVGRRDKSALARNLGWQVEAVRRALEAAGVEPLPPITPVLCFVEGDWPWLSAPDAFEDVLLESPESLGKRIAATNALDADEIDRLTGLLAHAMPAKT